MKHYRYLLTSILALSFAVASAHQDFFLTKDFGNVKVRIKTGFKYEEIAKVFILGQLAEKLSKQLNYSGSIFLDFNHHYTGNCNPDYFLSYDKGKIQDSWSGAEKGKDFLKKNSIVVRQVSRRFDAEITLKLLEYALHNLAQIKSSQKEINYNKNYCQWIINSIDTTLIKKHLLVPTSEQLKNILNAKVERLEIDFRHGISYFFKGNQYNVFARGYDKVDTTLLKLDNIYDFKKVGSSTVVVFDTDSSFYYVNQHENKVSKRQVIQNIHDFFEPFKVENIGGKKLSIYFWHYPKGTLWELTERTLIYLTKEDELIQDLDKLIGKE